MKKLLVALLLFVSRTAHVHNVIDLMNCDIHLEKNLLLRICIYIYIYIYANFIKHNRHFMSTYIYIYLYIYINRERDLDVGRRNR